MGHPKALLDWDDRRSRRPQPGCQPLITYHIDGLRPFAERVVVVLGAHADRIKGAISGVEIVENCHWKTTQPLDSLALALRDRDCSHGVLVTPVDVVPATADTLARLLNARAPAVPCVEHKEGHPVLLDEALAHVARAGDVPGGLGALLGSAQRVECVDFLLALDFDDPHALAKIRTELG